MDGGTSADLGARALCEGSECFGGRTCLRLSWLRPVLPRAGCPHDRDCAACAAGPAKGHIPFVANLIEPFAGIDAGAVASRLLARFGSLSSALTSTVEDDGAGEDAEVLRKMRAARVLVLEAAREQIVRRPVSALDPALHAYLRNLLGGQPHEELHAIFLAADHGYIADERIASGNGERLVGSMRRLVARAFELQARGLILVHNHPSGNAQASEEDIATTARLNDLVGELDLALVDHLIVTRAKVFSFRAAGLL